MTLCCDVIYVKYEIIEIPQHPLYVKIVYLTVKLVVLSKYLQPGYISSTKVKVIYFVMSFKYCSLNANNCTNFLTPA